MKYAASAQQNLPRRRLPVVCTALLLLWAAGWYGWGGGLGLFWFTAVLALAALALPRPLPSTARAFIWSALALAVVALAVNIERVTPAGDVRDMLRAYQYDRVVTLIFALGLAALCFRPTHTTVALAAAASLPLIMLTLARAEALPGSRGHEAPIVWGVLALIILLQQAERWSAARARPGPGGAWREWWPRLAAPLAVLALALWLAPWLERGAHLARERLARLTSRHNFASRYMRRGGELTLRPPPSGWGGHLRSALTIEAPAPPGYLREAAYSRYAGGEWMAEQPETAELEAERELLREAEDDDRNLYLLTTNRPPAGGGVALVTWRYIVMDGRLVNGLCLPGAARRLRLAGGAPWMDRDGCVRAAPETLPPEDYQIELPTGAAAAAAAAPVALAREPLAAAYLDVPSHLSATVSNLAEDCAGLLESDNAEAAAAAVIRHFERHFSYSLKPPPPRAGGDRLQSFMEARQGHCALFASAAAMALRAQGWPTRVVAGYFCHERQPFGHRYVARARDAHAWAEVWDARARRWLLVEATPATGMPTAWPRPSRLRLAWEWLAFGWRAAVAAVQRVNIIGAVAAAGVWLFEVVVVRVWFWGALLPLAALWHWWRRRRRGEGESAQARLRRLLTREMTRLERRAAPAHLRRQAEECWNVWARRMRQTLPPESAARLADLVERYETLRYGDAPGAAAVAQWRFDARRW